MAPILAKHNPIAMIKTGRAGGFFRLASLAFCFAMSLSLPGLSQTPASQNPYQPLPQDTGVLGLKQELLRLQTTARLMQVVAHPDDEDGGMLTLESRGHGVATLLLTLTHGEGGQNKLGSNLFDELGVLRTLELTASDRYYGVEQRFSHVADFGYSKNPEETFEKWHGHDVALGDIVRVIRTFRPDVLTTRFSGTERDGHGHHQASAILTKEAFRAAADSKRFPEQIAAGLPPWQPKKLYIGNVCGFGAMTCPAENYTVKLNTGVVNPVLGVSYVQFAMEGLRHQLSQGAGGWSVEPGDRFTYYKLVDSVLPLTTDKDGHEKDFFDGLDTSLPGLASRLGDEEKKVPQLRAGLVEIAGQLKQAAQLGTDPNDTVRPLLAALDSLGHFVGQNNDLSASARQDLVARLQEKEEHIQAALNLALNASMEATAIIPSDIPNQQNSLAISPGQKFDVHAKFHNGSKHPLSIKDIILDGITPAAVKEPDRVLQPGSDYETNFQVQLPSNFPVTRPAVHRNDPERDSVYVVDEPQYATLPFPPPPFRVIAHYDVPDLASPTHRDSAVQTYATFPEISAPVVVPFTDEKGQTQDRPLNVTPVYSVMLEPGEQIIRVNNGTATTVKVGVSCNLTGAQPGQLRLEAPVGWRIQPDELQVRLSKRGDKQDFEFKIFPLVTREDLESTYYYQPAIQRVSVVDVKIPNDVKIGYIMGAGDDIPTVLKQIGLDVTVIPAEKVASEDLSRYRTIVLGIRAYDTQKDVVANNKRLLDYVAGGGTLIVQYDTGVSDFNSGHLTPYPAQLSRARVSVEEAPVEILAPDDPVFHYPNQITPRDFDGWVQERGLYFMNQWDSNFKALLACHDPGEQPQKGGLLKAQYGKGVYIYNAYAFFRQLPAGVPGAIRLYVNLLAAGHGAGH